MSGLTLAKKITLGGINGVRAGFKDVKEQRHIARIMGRAVSVEAKDSQMGVSFKFTGEFRAINEDGEESAAPVCYLIAPADAMLKAALDGAGGQPVEFAFDFFVVPNATAVLGYEYKVKPLLETKPSEPLAALMAAITAPPPVKKQLQLTSTASEAAEQKADEKQEAEMVAEGGSEPTAPEAPKKGKHK